jgi:uncharacterized protein YndB with AHSA1/START domain
VHGTSETIDNKPALSFERHLDHPVEKVWRAVTDPEELAHWFPATVKLEALEVGARMTFAFPEEMELPTGSGEITECDPPRLLAYSWDGFEEGVDHLRFELEPAAGGEGCVLRFTHLLTASERASRDAAGWHVCLDRLAERLAGADTVSPSGDPTADWRGLYEEYQRRGLPAGAELPA